MSWLIIIKLLLATPWLIGLSIRDCKTHQLPNCWVGGGILVMSVIAAAFSLNYLLASLLTAFLGALFLLLPFFLRAAGAGDVKMMFAAGVIAGPGQTLNLILLISLSGLLLALIMIALRRVELARLRHYWHCLVDFRYDRKMGRAQLPDRNNEACRVPFGVAISAGLMGNLLLQLLQV